MNIAIRVDASTQIGTGHLIRCLTLADALKQRGVQIRFVSFQMPEYFQDLLTTKGHEFMMLNNGLSEINSGDLSHSHWLSTSQYIDAQNTVQALAGQIWDWLIVDHYALDYRWESVLRQTAKNILVIDDIADRHHDCDVLLDQNFYTDMNTRYTGKVPGHCQLLLGPDYALLRDEFRQLHEQAEPHTGSVKRILVFFGGMDKGNYTTRAIKAVDKIDSHDLHVDVVIGAQHTHRQQIESVCVDRNFFCHVQTNQMAELMTAADLSIGAGGSATWERCCLGLPTLTICTADNQRKQIADAASEGLLYAPRLKGELILVLKHHLKTLMENDYLRNLLSRNSMKAVDGRGVLRIMRRLGCGDVEIRVAKHNDSQNLFNWRNHPDVRAVSRNTDTITWESHQKWFASIMSDHDRLLLIGHHNDFPVGVVRFDVRGNESEVSIYLVPNIQKIGLGQDLLQNAERWLIIHRPNVSRIRAHILNDNERSHRLFLKTDYQVESTSYLKSLR